MPRVVVGLGQLAAGDDAVGLHVIARLRDAPPPDTALFVLSDAMELVELLRGREFAVVVDAWVTELPPGTVRVFGMDALDAASMVRTSSHGTSVGQALELGRTLYPEDFAPVITIVAVAIQCATPGVEVSRSVSAAVDEASGRVRELCTAKSLHDRASPPT